MAKNNKAKSAYLADHTKSTPAHDDGDDESGHQNTLPKAVNHQKHPDRKISDPNGNYYANMLQKKNDADAVMFVQATKKVGNF